MNRRVSVSKLTASTNGFLTAAVDEWVNGKRVAGESMKLSIRYHYAGWILN